MKIKNDHCAPYYSPEAVRQAALDFIDAIEAGYNFPSFRSGSLILRPNQPAEYDLAEGQANQSGRSVFLLKELIITLILDPIMWSLADLTTTCCVLDPRGLEAYVLIVSGDEGAIREILTPQRVRHTVDELRITHLKDLQCSFSQAPSFAAAMRSRGRCMEAAHMNGPGQHAPLKLMAPTILISNEEELHSGI